MLGTTGQSANGHIPGAIHYVGPNSCKTTYSALAVAQQKEAAQQQIAPPPPVNQNPNPLAGIKERLKSLIPSPSSQHLRLALRAQAQCRARLETWAVIKNPQPVAFVRQANIANGPQQVNNAPAQQAESSRARESEHQQNKLLEVESGERLEFGKADAARETDSSLEAVGALHGRKDCSR